MSSVIKSSNVHIVFGNNHTKFEEQEEQQKEQESNIIREAKEQYDKIVTEATEKAAEIIKNAEIEASKIKDEALSDAKQEAENIKEESAKDGYKEGHENGTKEGYEKGYQEGFDSGKEVADKLIAEANDIKRNYLNEKEKVLGSIEEDVINLTFEICEKILNQKLIEDEEVVTNMVIKGIKSLNTKDSVTIRVSEYDFEKVEQSKEKILTKASLIESIEVKKDINLNKGDCIIESSKGNVDVSLSLQIEEMKSKINDLLDSE